MVTELEQAKKAIKEQLRWCKHSDVLIDQLIDQLADIAADQNDVETEQKLRVAARAAEQILGLKMAIRAEKKASRQRIELLEARITAYQSQCSHPETVYFPDASGNNDDFTECLCCGAIVS